MENSTVGQPPTVMVFQLPELSENLAGPTYVLTGTVAAIIVAATLTARGPNLKLDAIPTVGSSGWFGSWFAGFKNKVNITAIIQEGYEKHKSAPFKVAEPYHWLVVLSNRKHIEEIRNVSDDVLSMEEATTERLGTFFTLGHQIIDNPIHVALILPRLTRSLETLYPEIKDEIVTAFNEVLDLTGHEWKSVPALDAIQRIVCRASNRVFVGLPLCRDPDWIDLNIQYTIDVFKASALIGLFPKISRPLAAYFFMGPPRRDRARGLKLIGPMIEERLRCLHEYGNEWDGKPNDVISWLMEKAKSPQLTVDVLAVHVLAVNFSAIHTSSTIFTSALFYLAANPQYIQPLREEVQAIIEKEGWSKDSVSEMRKVDSFLKECQRLEGVTTMSISRKAVKEFTFSDGTVIPKGTMVGVATQSLQLDGKSYKNAHAFEPFRFATIHGDEGDVKNQFISTAASEYLPFGCGRHACPGRFFAANELKTMLAHVVITYDIKLEGGATPPRSVYYGAAILVDPHARILFRKRVD